MLMLAANAGSSGAESESFATLSDEQLATNAATRNVATNDDAICRFLMRTSMHSPTQMNAPAHEFIISLCSRAVDGRFARITATICCRHRRIGGLSVAS